jgi:crossover junction endodeoxyribonuclease RuvC
MIVAGLDLSLTNAGVVVISTDPLTIRESLHSSKPGKRVTLDPVTSGRKLKPIYPVTDRAERLMMLADSILAVLPPVLDLAVVEAPSFASIGGFTHERSGLYWMIMTQLVQHCEIAEVAPRTRALYATGKGNADKMSVVDATLTRHELNFKDDNLIDAFVLASMGLRSLGQPLEVDLPQAQIDALNSVYWHNRKATQ